MDKSSTHVQVSENLLMDEKSLNKLLPVPASLANFFHRLVFIPHNLLLKSSKSQI